MNSSHLFSLGRTRTSQFYGKCACGWRGPTVDKRAVAELDHDHHARTADAFEIRRLEQLAEHRRLKEKTARVEEDVVRQIDEGERQALAQKTAQIKEEFRKKK